MMGLQRTIIYCIISELADNVENEKCKKRSLQQFTASELCVYF